VSSISANLIRPADVHMTAHPAASGEVVALTLVDARKLFHDKGYDLLIADANVRVAEADVETAAQSPNPQAALNTGFALNYDPSGCSTCSNWVYGLSFGDNGALFDMISGKKHLRRKVAEATLAAAKASKLDAERQLANTMANAYLTFAVSIETENVLRKVGETYVETYRIQYAKYPGAVDMGALARIQTAVFEAQAQVDSAIASRRNAEISLTFLLGYRGTMPTIEMTDKPLEYRVPEGLAQATLAALHAKAKQNRPDILVAQSQLQSAQAAIESAKRLQFPDIQLMAQFYGLGYGQSAVQPPTVALNIQFTLPLFYDFRGEIGHAAASATVAEVTKSKAEAQVDSDVDQAWAAYLIAKKLVEAMRDHGLDSARLALEITRTQYLAGSCSLTDLLDAQRTAIATEQEYLQDLSAYWSAVFQLEQAVGVHFT
jgi:outer membrane protein TolC